MGDRTKLAVVIVAVLCLAVIFWLSDQGGEGKGSLFTGSPLVDGEPEEPSVSSLSKLPEDPSNPQEVNQVHSKRWGLVLDPLGRAVSGAQVSLIESVDSKVAEASPILLETRSDLQGRFDMGLAIVDSATPLYFLFVHPDYDPEFLLFVRSHGGSPSEFRLRFKNPSVRGIVLGANGEEFRQPRVMRTLHVGADRNSRVLRFQEPTQDDREFYCFTKRRSLAGIEFTHPSFGTFADRNFFDNDMDAQGRLIFSVPDGSPLKLSFVSTQNGEGIPEIRFAVVSPASKFISLGESGSKGEATVAHYPDVPEIRIELLSKVWHLSTIDNPNAAGYRRRRFPILERGERLVVIPVSKGSEIAGVLIDGRSGVPMPGVRLDCYGSGIAGYSNRRSTVSNKNGEFRFAHIDGGWNSLVINQGDLTLDVMEMLKDHQPTLGPFARLAADSTPRGLSGKLHRIRIEPQFRRVMVYVSDTNWQENLIIKTMESGSVSGKVVGAMGMDVASLTVLMVKSDSVFGLNALQASKSTKHKVTTGDDGTFFFKGVPPGEWKVLCDPPHAPGAQSSPFAVVSGEETKAVEVIIPAAIPQRFSVIDEFGQPVSGLMFRVLHQGTGINRSTIQLDELQTDVAGEAVSNRLTAGRHFIRFLDLDSSGLTTSEESSLFFDVGVEPQDHQKVIKLVKAHSLVGQILDQEDQPIRSAFVSFERLLPDGTWKDLSFVVCKTNRSGKFERTVDRDGVFRIRVVSVPRLRGSRDFIIPSSDTFSPESPGQVFRAQEK